ncbi:hypothetical protein PHYSODRAFT_320419 [Phytophthora sojae]|uniref:Uncharacterized protein n=1 Tax=Phytophthora sojae (strain P6497) TaxID=1094619 RepID=G5AJH2_PHYSP|nr:hypothetical protein PHYSODRAFT_320419 [Phytophthora sojae]EGZ04331.1 hypothetical protein PHYSODRAFT_320419 [Phytophthora sojae]|eukprot:XP_009540223.1 hypothetical protein PHYSODRAFT_320419 [Phytophthora sojae]
MRLHQAVWLYASLHGNDYARAYAKERLQLSEDARRVRDSKWLLNKGGVRLREQWRALPSPKRRRLLQETPDLSFPEGVDGILDERRRNLPRQKSVLESARELSATDMTSPDVADKVVRMANARSNYHQILCEEHRLRVRAEYNRGSLAGVLESAASSVISAVALAKADCPTTTKADCPTTSDEAFAAVCTRLTCVLGTMLGTAQFDPDPDDDQPSRAFSESRIQAARRKYDVSVREVQAACDEEHVGAACKLFPAAHRNRYFGNLLALMQLVYLNYGNH